MNNGFDEIKRGFNSHMQRAASLKQPNLKELLNSYFLKLGSVRSSKTCYTIIEFDLITKLSILYNVYAAYHYDY